MKIISHDGKDLSSWELNGIEQLRLENKAMKTQIESMRYAAWVLANEMNCRLEHGANIKQLREIEKSLRQLAR